MTSRSWRRVVDRLAADHGCRVSETGGKHLRLRHPDGWTVIASASPSDERAVGNLRADLRRASRKA